MQVTAGTADVPVAGDLSEGAVVEAEVDGVVKTRQRCQKIGQVRRVLAAAAGVEDFV